MLILKSNTEYVGESWNLPYLPVLDHVEAVAAYSLRKMRRNYTGPAIEVIRASDLAVKKISFKGGYLNLEELTDFAGTSDLRVKVWYDQTGNGFDLSVESQALQPRIAKLGKPILDKKSMPAIEFNGTTNKLIDSANSLGAQLGNSPHFAAFSVFTPTAISQDSSNLRRITGFNYIANGSIHKVSLYVSTETNKVSFGARGNMEAPTSILTSSLDAKNTVALSYFKEQEVGLKVNDSALQTVTHNTVNTSGGGGRFIAGSSNANSVESSNFAGQISEIIIFNKDILDSELLKLHQQINDYYR